MKAGATAGGFICICGDTFFNQRVEIEQATGIARELRSTLDLASMPLPKTSFGAGSYPVDNFVGAQDGIHYINYGASIIAGSKLIGDDDAYMIPVGVSDWIVKAYAPAMTETYVNTDALEMYSWTFTDEFQGTTQYFESNVLYANVRPQFIRNLTK